MSSTSLFLFLMNSIVKLEAPCGKGLKISHNCCFFLDVIGPGKFVTIKPIPIQRLPEYCAINHADRNKGFREEFLVSKINPFLFEFRGNMSAIQQIMGLLVLKCASKLPQGWSRRTRKK